MKVFWAPIRNNEVVNRYIRKAINDPNWAEKMDNVIGLGFGSTEKVANELVIKGTGTGISGLSKAAQTATKMASSGAEMGYVSGIDTSLQGGTLEDTLKATGQGVLLGGALRGIGIGIKHAITPKIATEGVR